MMIAVAFFISLVLIGMAGIALVNTLALPRLKKVGRGPEGPANRRANFSLPYLGWDKLKFALQALSPPGGKKDDSNTCLPRISLLIPARNEAGIIATTLHHLLAQSYPNFEVIVLDDHSEDETFTLVERLSRQEPRLRVIQGQPLPDGWLGKNWACCQLAQAARGEWLVFTDADVRWQPGALAGLAGEMERTQADLLTVWPTQQTETWGERLVVPLMALVVVGYLFIPFVHYTPWSMFAAANGQCLAFRRRAYEQIGGHQGVWNEVLEDVLLARRVKAHGLRLRMVDGAGLITCRMYQNWVDVRDGYAKNILAGYGGQVFFLVLATIFHWLIFLGPWVWLLAGAVADLGGMPPLAHWPVWPLLLIALGLGLRALTAAVTRQRLLDALLLPLSVLLMTRIAGQAVWWQWRYGGPCWKGRIIGRTGQLEGWKDGEMEEQNQEKPLISQPPNLPTSQSPTSPPKAVET